MPTPAATTAAAPKLPALTPPWKKAEVGQPSAIEGSAKTSSTGLHRILDAAGFLPPPVGPVADGANAALYLKEGDRKNASLSGASAVPGIGDAAAIAKIGKNAVKASVKGADTAGSVSSTAAKLQGPTKATGFADSRTLARHHEDHGADFGARTPREYEKMAKEFFAEARAKKLPAKIDDKGDVLVWDKNTDRFAVYTKDGGVRTFYKPDTLKHPYRTNQEYWEHQRGSPLEW